MNLVSVLPASYCQLHGNSNGILLVSPRFKKFKIKKTMADRSFMVAATVLWNSLPLLERQAKNVDSFKCLVKTYLFSMAFIIRF